MYVSRLKLPSAGDTLAQSDDQQTNRQAKKRKADDMMAPSSVRESLDQMFCNPVMADVYFRVGRAGRQKRIPAHKFVLAMGSEVFHTMFYGSMAKDKTADPEEIEVPDVKPAAFLNLLKSLYSDYSAIEVDTLVGTFYAAKKYMVGRLTKACARLLKEVVGPTNVFYYLSQTFFEEPEIIEPCWRVIDIAADAVFKSGAFLKICNESLQKILERDSLNVVSELSVYEACVRWATAECGRQDLTVTPENQRKVLGENLFLIRFPAMSAKEFANGPAKSGILTFEECHNLFLFYTADDAPELAFSTLKRCGPKISTVNRLQNAGSNFIRLDVATFRADQPIALAGVGLRGSFEGPCEYTVRLATTYEQVVLQMKDVTINSSGSKNTTTQVFFGVPVNLKRHDYYTVDVLLKGDRWTFRGEDLDCSRSGLHSAKSDGVEFWFRDSHASWDCKQPERGQILELLFFNL